MLNSPHVQATPNFMNQNHSFQKHRIIHEYTGKSRIVSKHALAHEHLRFQRKDMYSQTLHQIFKTELVSVDLLDELNRVVSITSNFIMVDPCRHPFFGITLTNPLI